MGWVDELQNHVVGLDTAPLIYLIEEHPRYLPVVQPFFEALDRREFRVVTSALTLMEVLVHPLRYGDEALAAQYRAILLQAKGIEALPITLSIAEGAARLRAIYNLTTPDSLQVAAMLSSGATHIVTNDRDFRSYPGVIVISIDRLCDSVPLLE